MSADNLTHLLQSGYLLYQKSGTIEVEKIPQFGEITLFYQDGKFTHLKKVETKK